MAGSVAAVLLLQSASWAAFPIHFPLFHRADAHEWTQFRMGPDNNAVVPGTLETSWRLETGGQISASPTLVDGTLFIGNNSGSLYALDAATGRIVWKYHVTGPLMSAPLVYHDMVIVGEGDAQSKSNMPSEPILVGQGPSALQALDRRTGKLRWRTPLGGSAMPTPAIIDGVLIDHNGAGWVSGFDPETGVKRFQKRLQSVASMSAILPLGGGRFATTGVGTNAVLMMNAHDGSIVWQTVFPSGASGLGDCPPVSDGSRILCDYVAPVMPDRATVVGHGAVERAYAVNATTGAKEWDVPLEAGPLAPRNEAAVPLLAAGSFWIGSAVAPAMHALDPATGHLRWKIRTRGPVKGGAVFVDGTVYFGDYGGYLWAVDAANGRVVGVKNEHVAFNVGSPIVDGKTLIMGSDSGAILAVPLKDIRAGRDF
jgi:outer membrane protein assembly factor BamB